MSTDTLYGFLTDDAFRSSSMIGTADADAQNYGMLFGEPANYFNNRTALRDSRKARMSFLDGSTPLGSMELIFDADQFDTNAFANMTDIENTLLFNIIERIVYRGEYADSEIETMLANTADYGGYVANTYTHSLAEEKISVQTSEKSSTYVDMREWSNFQFITDNVSLKIHIWHSRSAFGEDYPCTTITSVLAPYDPAHLVDTAYMLSEGAFSMLIAGADHMFSSFDTEAIARDQNGVYIYKTKYVLSATSSVQLSFALSYRGPRVPSTLECRKAIKAYIEEHTSVDESTFNSIFPELYVSSRFFIIPMWDSYEAYSDRDIFCSIQNLQRMTNIADLFFAGTDSTFRSNYLELMTQAQSKMMLITLPDELNDTLFSIRELHPTYQDYSSQQTGWKYLSADTQEFAGKLVRCLATLLGESEDTGEFIQTDISDMHYWTFTSGSAEYMVLDKTSYLSFLENLSV